MDFQQRINFKQASVKILVHPRNYDAVTQEAKSKLRINIICGSQSVNVYPSSLHGA
jgi:hypothetical protein